MNAKNLKTIASIVSTTLAATTVAVATLSVAQAQTSQPVRRSTKRTPAAARRVNPSSKRVSIELQSASVRKALDRLFRQSGADFSLDSGITGSVSLKVTDQPFDRALQLILRNSTQPLTYEVENGTYFIKPARAVSSVKATARSPRVASVEDAAPSTAGPENTAPFYEEAQSIGPNTVFVPSTNNAFQVGNNVILPGGYGGFGSYSGFGYTSGGNVFQPGGFNSNGFNGGYNGGFGNYNNFGGYSGQFSTPSIVISGPGFYNPATGIGAYYGFSNGGFNVYSGSRTIFGF